MNNGWVAGYGPKGEERVQLTGSEPLEREAFTSPIVIAHEKSMDVARRAEELMNRLLGDRPREAPGSAPMPTPTSPNGLFATLTFVGVEIGVNLQRIEMALARIEKALP
jgi:hypothetical protein